MDESRLTREISPTPTGGASTTGLPPFVLEEASRRLGATALLYSIAYTLSYFGSHLFGGAVDHLWAAPFQTSVAVASILMGLAVFMMTRWLSIAPERLLDLGLVFEVLGAFGISMSVFWGRVPRLTDFAPDAYVGVPWECVWIVIFPLLAPNTTGKTALASLAAASTAPLAILVSSAAGAIPTRLPLVELAVYFLFTTYLCAGIAVVIGRDLYRYGSELKRAQEIGSYRLTRPLGRGGMGEVWVAKHRMLARDAAIKLIRPESLGADEATRRTLIRRFEREARATAALGSIHTVELYDFGVTQDGAFYYVMELLEGLSLDDLVRRFGPVEAERAVYLLRQACHSLADAHENGLIHRDVKPANLYTCRVGPDYDFVKVLDFGLVRARDDLSGAVTELTADGVAAGTPAFMAPEIAMGKGEIDGRADVYGLGCVAYWLLTGQRVFQEETGLAQALAHVREQPIPPSRRTELDVPAELERLVMACLEKDPADRPAGASALREALASALEGVWTGARAREWWELHMPETVAVGTHVPAEVLRSPRQVVKGRR